MHLDLSTSAMAYQLLQSGTCPALKKRDDVSSCINDLFDTLAANYEFLSSIISLYMGSPVAWTVKSMTDLPRWSDASQQAAFMSAVIIGVNQLEQVVNALSDVSAIFMTYAILNIAIEKILHAPDNYNTFSIGRSGKMDASCPAKEELSCSHQLCHGGDDGICTGFFSPCACNNGGTCPNKDSKRFTLVCDACGGKDDLTGACKGTSDGSNKGSVFMMTRALLVLTFEIVVHV